jgi:hypothetical protein
MSRLGTVGLCALVFVFFASLLQAAEPEDAATRAILVNLTCIQPIDVIDPDNSGAYGRIKRALDEETFVEFQDLPLSDAVLYLKDRHHIEIQFDSKSMDTASIGVDTPVTRTLKNISLRSALRLMLGPLDLTYIIKDEVLLITTPEAAACESIVRIYPVSDLLTAASANKPGQDIAGLIELIKGTAGPNSWQGSGGRGSIQPWAPGQSLVIRQTLARHEEIQPLLAGLRKSRNAETRRSEYKTAGDNR